MATYTPAQPFWKRAIAGILDFLVAIHLLGWTLSLFVALLPSGWRTFGNDPTYETFVSGIGFRLEGMAALLLLAMLVAYFYLLGRSGGTIFQRLLGFRRARSQ